MADTEDFNTRVIDEFRENGGKAGGPVEGFDLLILHSIGAKSGTPRISPLVYFPYKGRRYLIASAGGAPKHPSWYHNLKANPDVMIEVSSASGSASGSSIVTEKVTASEIHGAEHAEVWRSLITAMPHFNDYQRNTTRQIPLLALEPRN